MSCFSTGVIPSVSTEKNGTTPRGSTIAKIEAMAVAPNARSTMVFPGEAGADQCLRISFIQPPLSYTARLRLLAVSSNSFQEMTWSFSLLPFENRSVFVPFTLLGRSPFTVAICRAYSNEISLSAGMFHPFVRSPYGEGRQAYDSTRYKCLSFV